MPSMPLRSASISSARLPGAASILPMSPYMPAMVAETGRWGARPLPDGVSSRHAPRRTEGPARPMPAAARPAPPLAPPSEGKVEDDNSQTLDGRAAVRGHVARRRGAGPVGHARDRCRHLSGGPGPAQGHGLLLVRRDRADLRG